MGRVTATTNVGRAGAGVLRWLAVGVATAALAAVMGGLGAQPAAATGGGGGKPVKPVKGVQCVVERSRVDGGTATFTVGPPDCTTTTAAISFSTYTLPGGYAEPFKDQTVFAHATGNGQRYGAGTFTLTAALPSCRWQSDLYWGTDRATAPHSHPKDGLKVGWDLNQGKPCVAPTPPETTPPAPTPPVETPPATPPRPADTVVPGEWVDGAWACTDTEVTQTRTVTTTSSVWDGSTWVDGTPVARTETRTYALTPDELAAARAAAQCGVVPTPGVSATPAATTPAGVPTPAPTPTPTVRSDVLAGGPAPSPSVTYRSDVLAASSGEVLASTGSSAAPFVVLAAVLILAGGVLLALRRRTNGADA